ncbi:MAG TPA: superoxide dismutase family protein [Steroidobacteraceae bacterium]
MKYLVCVCAAAALLTACGQKKEEPPAPNDEQATATPSAPPVTEPEPAPSASVQLASTQGNTATGNLTVVTMGDGVHFTGTLQGLKPDSEFGFHVHEKGDCSAPDASSAGGHFNPAGVEHGNPQSQPHHAGDMPNAKSDAQGNAEVNAHVSGLTLSDGGPNDIIGKAVVLHEKADDYKTQPSGNSGARIACGVVTAGGM